VGLRQTFALSAEALCRTLKKKVLADARVVVYDLLSPSDVSRLGLPSRCAKRFPESTSVFTAGRRENVLISLAASSMQLEAGELRAGEGCPC
jgi:hypothetical protein